MYFHFYIPASSAAGSASTAATTSPAEKKDK